VLNELLANALKHAFPDDQAGNVAVRAAREGESYCLTVSDDGAGMSPERRSKQPGLGGRLMRSLAAQLGGTMTVGRANDGRGTRQDSVSRPRREGRRLVEQRFPSCGRRRLDGG
jgi:two-component sensor histidine kinase